VKCRSLGHGLQIAFPLAKRRAEKFIHQEAIDVPPGFEAPAIGHLLLRPVVGTSAGGKGSPTGSLTDTPTRGHALAHTGPQLRAHEAVRRSKAVDGSGGGGEAMQKRRLLFWFLGFESALGKMRSTA
jgi:hypothetical protein